MFGSVAHFNLSALSKKDSIVAVNIDNPVAEGFETYTLKTPGYPGTAGGGPLQLIGFTGIDNPETGLIELLIVNNGPSVNAETGGFADQYLAGANQTIELFETGADAREIRHVRTYAHKHIATPNRVAAIDRETFYLTNDHGVHKLGLVSKQLHTSTRYLFSQSKRHHLSPFLSTGDTTLCTSETCRPVAPGLTFPNGLARGPNGLVYVPDSFLGIISVFAPTKTNSLKKIDEIKIGYSIDNISIDKNGDLYVAAFPVGLGIFKAYEDPWGARPASAAFRVRMGEDGYVVDKIIEDGEGEILPASTTVVHDGKTGRLFFSSKFPRSLVESFANG